MINLHESMGPGPDQTIDPWICSQTRICCQTRYQLRYTAWLHTLSADDKGLHLEATFSMLSYDICSQAH